MHFKSSKEPIPWQTGSFADHVPSFWQTIVPSPRKTKPLLHEKLASLPATLRLLRVIEP